MDRDSKSTKRVHRALRWCFLSIDPDCKTVTIRFDVPLRLVLGSLILFWHSGAQAADRPAPTWPHAAVATDHPVASQAGVEILQQGGNAVDAAVAVGFALSVLRPASSGMGGGGFMVIWDAERQQSIALDYRERAPMAASRDMFLKDGLPADASRKGGLAVAVPGHVAGLCHALDKFGVLSLPKVLAPAIRMAEDGVILDTRECETRVDLFHSLSGTGLGQRFPHLRRHYSIAENPKAGLRITSPQLPLLKLIAASGPDAFYTADAAKQITETVRSAGGIMALEDLSRMDVVERRPLTGALDDLTVVTMPPPSSGGIVLLQSLNILNSMGSRHFNGRIESLGHNSPEYLHVLAETMKHAFADRAEFLGDADFADVPVQRLISQKYAEQLAGTIRLDRTGQPDDYGRFMLNDDAGTSHFSIIDASGNAVSCTETINTGYGSWVVEPKYGIVLNNEMDDFAAKPGVPNAFGLRQSESNAVAPRKKPLSSMTPTILVRDGKAVYVAGGSGGPRIISTTLQVVLNMTRFKMDPRRAVEMPRIHHQWQPDTLYIEEPLIDRVKTDMEKFGHRVKLRNKIAVCQAAARVSAGVTAHSDSRKHGKAAGF